MIILNNGTISIIVGAYFLASFAKLRKEGKFDEKAFLNKIVFQNQQFIPEKKILLTLIQTQSNRTYKMFRIVWLTNPCNFILDICNTRNFPLYDKYDACFCAHSNFLAIF